MTTTPVLTLTDTTAALWDRLYLVRLPRLEVVSIEYLQTYGTYITGDRTIDAASANQLITTMRPIHELAEYHRNHVNIYLVHADDAVEIHQAVHAHLAAWERKLRYGLNNGAAPVEDLITLESFARTVYLHAKHRMPPELPTSLFVRSLQNPLMYLTPEYMASSILAGMNQPQTTVINPHEDPEAADAQPTDHLAEFLRHHIGSLNLRNTRRGT